MEAPSGRGEWDRHDPGGDRLLALLAKSPPDPPVPHQAKPGGEPHDPCGAPHLGHFPLT